jgi:hypothetical protein
MAARKSLGKIKDREYFSEDMGDYVKIECNGVQVACIRDGQKPEEVFKTFLPKDV